MALLIHLLFCSLIYTIRHLGHRLLLREARIIFSWLLYNERGNVSEDICLFFSSYSKSLVTTVSLSWLLKVIFPLLVMSSLYKDCKAVSR